MARTHIDPSSPRPTAPGAHWLANPFPGDSAEPRFRHLVDTSPSIIWSWDASGRVTYANRRLFEYTGLAPDGDMAEWPRLVVHPDDLSRQAQAWERASGAGELLEIELRLRRHDGAYRWFLARGIPVRGDDGAIGEWLGCATDIDQQKCSEANLRFLANASVALGEVGDTEGTLQRIAHLAVPFFSDWCDVTVKDAAGGIRRVVVKHWDPAKVKHIEEVERRYPRDESSGAMRVMNSGEPIFEPQISEEHLRTVAHDEEHMAALRKLGLKSYICVPIRAKAEVIGALTFVTAESGRVYSPFDLQVAKDLAARASIALENASLVEALREADRRKDEFLAVLAHELRNPLAPVRNAVQILRSHESATPQLQWTYDVIDRQVRQMARLVDDLLDVSRITADKIELRKERIELGAAIRNAIESSRPLMERAGHELTVRVPQEPIHVEADLARLGQVIANLLNNAAKYTPPGGHIWVVAERRDGEAVIRVCDNGIGIDRRMQPRIFDMFIQGSSPEDRSQGGLGIGLTLVKRLVEMHGGSVEVRSDGHGMGSEFIVRLPAANGAVSPSPPASKATNGGARSARRRRVLVVDDNRDAADSLMMLLHSRGHDVRVAYDGLEAVGAALAFEPDVVLMDIGLPKLYGHEAARRIRAARGKDVLLVAITGWGQDEDRRRSQEAGFDFHMTKPVDPETIGNLIDEQR